MSQFEHDYLKRQIELLAIAIAQAIGKGADGANQEAADELDETIATATGLHAGLVLRLDPSTVLTLVGEQRARMLADALEARAWLLGPGELALSLATARRLRRRLELEQQRRLARGATEPDQLDEAVMVA